MIKWNTNVSIMARTYHILLMRNANCFYSLVIPRRFYKQKREQKRISCLVAHSRFLNVDFYVICPWAPFCQSVSNDDQFSLVCTKLTSRFPVNLKLAILTTFEMPENLALESK